MDGLEPPDAIAIAPPSKCCWDGPVYVPRPEGVPVVKSGNTAHTIRSIVSMVVGTCAVLPPCVGSMERKHCSAERIQARLC